MSTQLGFKLKLPPDLISFYVEWFVATKKCPNITSSPYSKCRCRVRIEKGDYSGNGGPQVWDPIALGEPPF